MEEKISLRKLKRLVERDYGWIQASSYGNVFTPLTSSFEIYKEFYSAIMNAKKSINMEFFIFQADGVGKVFADLLCKKARGGVKVNVILDFLGSYPFRDRSKLYNDMIKSGVNLRFSLSFSDVIRAIFKRRIFFRRSGVRMFFKRNHRKILIVDGEIAFTGGANIGEEYLSPNYPDKTSWHDFQFKIRGPVVNTLQFTFFRSWIGDGGFVDAKNLDIFFKKQVSLKDGIHIRVLQILLEIKTNFLSQL